MIMTKKKLYEKLEDELDFNFYEHLKVDEVDSMDLYASACYTVYGKNPYFSLEESIKIIEEKVNTGKKYKKFIFPNCGVGDLIAAFIVAKIANPKYCYGNVDDENIAAIARKRLMRLGVPAENITSYDKEDYNNEFVSKNDDEETLTINNPKQEVINFDNDMARTLAEFIKINVISF